MREFIYRMKDPMGFHARPAARLFMAAAGFHCRIEAEAAGRTADCKEFMSLMSLDAGEGKEVTFRFDGDDETEAEKEIRSALERI